MQEKFGTNAVTGLNVGKGPHLIEDHELRESYNGWTDEDGVWRTAPGPTRLYSSYTAISCLAAGRMGGIDHVVWLDGNTLYDNGTNVGTITAGSTMDIVAIDDAFLIFGAAKNYIWDGAHLREQGAWQIRIGVDDGIHMAAAAEDFAVSSISEGATARITTSAANTFTVGDYAYIDGGDMVEIIGRNYRVTGVDVVDELYIDIECDSTDFTTYTTGATVYRNAVGLPDGDYKFYMTGTIELSDGRVLEGNPIGLGEPQKYTGVLWDTTEAQVFTVADQTIPLALEVSSIKWAVSSVPEFVIDGTIGVDYFPGVRLYRTKAGGVDFYLENSWRYGDTNLVYTSGANATFDISETGERLPDNQLGAVYESDLYDHGSAPQSDVGAFAGQRVLIADGHDIYWSDLDGIEYYNNANGYTPLGDVVTAIAPFRDGWAVFSCDRLWLVQILDGLPDIVEINTPVGTVWPKAMCTVDDGVLFLRDDGLWLFTGARVEKISRGAFASITSPQSVTAAGELLFVSGSEKSYVAIRRNGGWVWHESEHYRPYADSTNGKIYAASTFHVEQMFTGVRAGGRLATKHFGNKWLGKAIRVNLDFEGDTIPTVWVNGNRQSDVLGHVDDSSTQYRGRRVVRVSVPRLNNQFLYITLEMTGDCTVYGYEVEMAG